MLTLLLLLGCGRVIPLPDPGDDTVPDDTDPVDTDIDPPRECPEPAAPTAWLLTDDAELVEISLADRTAVVRGTITDDGSGLLDPGDLARDGDTFYVSDGAKLLAFTLDDLAAVERVTVFDPAAGLTVADGTLLAASAFGRIYAVLPSGDDFTEAAGILGDGGGCTVGDLTPDGDDTVRILATRCTGVDGSGAYYVRARTDRPELIERIEIGTTEAVSLLAHDGTFWWVGEDSLGEPDGLGGYTVHNDLTACVPGSDTPRRLSIVGAAE